MREFRFIWPHVRPFGRSFLLGLSVVPAGIALRLAIPFLVGEALNHLQVGTDPETIRRFALAIVGAALVSAVLLYLKRRVIVVASRRFEYSLRSALFRHLQTLSLSYYKQARTGDLMTRATSDIEAIRRLVGPALMYGADTIVTLLLAIPLMMWVDVRLALISLVPLFFISILCRFVGPKVHAAYRRVQELGSEIAAHSQENLSGMRVIKSYAREDREVEGFQSLNRQYVSANMRAIRLRGFIHPALEMLMGVSILFLLVFGGEALIGAELKVGEFVKFRGYQMMLFWPMIALGWLIVIAEQGRVGIRRLEEIFDATPDVADPPDPVRVERISGGISIRNLTFRYGDGPPVLDGISLEIPRGTTAAILGRTASGKSTLLSLIPRLYPVADGTIYIDGIDINRMPIEVLRRSVGYVPQESFLFSRSVRENLAFGRGGEAADEEVHQVARLAGLGADIEDFPLGYEQRVGERGITLSGGQKQRAAIARALLIDPAILLLDDAFSAVDTETEEEILRNVWNGTAERTTIVVSHRISTVRQAGRIYVLDRGRIVEEGDHDALVRQGGLYASIHRRQLIESELEELE